MDFSVVLFPTGRVSFSLDKDTVKKVPGSIAELDGRFERNRGESLDVGYDSQPKVTALPVFPTISRLMYEETSR